MNKLEKITLDNRLTIYLYPDTKKHTTIFQFITLFGGTSKDFIIDNKEVHFQDGLAHILEHYLVECNKYGNFIDILGKMEMSTNAATSLTHTKYYFEAVEKVDEGIKTIIRSVYNPIFTTDNLEKIKLPIYQEIKGKQRSKFFEENKEILHSTFKNIKFRSVIGTIENVKNTTTEDLKLCYETFYQPHNQIIIISGNYNKENILKTIKEEINNYTFKKHNVKKIDLNEEECVASKKSNIIFPTPIPYVDVTYKIKLPKMTPKEKVTLTFYLSELFNENTGISSPLYEKLIKEKIITTKLNASFLKIEDYILITIGSSTLKEKELTKEIINNFKNINFDKDLFELNKKREILNIILRDESLLTMTTTLSDNIINYDYHNLDTVEDIESFTFEKYKNVINNLNFNNYTITTINNEGSN